MTQPARRWMAAVCGVLVLWSCSSTSSGPRAPTPKVVLFVGDSILYEARVSLRKEMAARGWRAVVAARPGAALCDLTYEFQLRNDHARPSVIVVETQGDLFSRCMATDQPGVPVALASRAFLHRYRVAMDLFARVARTHGAKLIFVSPLPVPAMETNASLARLRALEVSVARRNREVSVTDVPRDSVSFGGQFAEMLPCLPSERSRAACTSTGIRVRETLQGLHLCPIPYYTADQSERGCRTYSSGAVRYSQALVDVVIPPTTAGP